MIIFNFLILKLELRLKIAGVSEINCSEIFSELIMN